MPNFSMVYVRLKHAFICHTMSCPLDYWRKQLMFLKIELKRVQPVFDLSICRLEFEMLYILLIDCCT